MTEQYVYTPRAFLQDADLAMGGDLVRGLVELELNAFDAYQRLRDKGELPPEKKARITVMVNSRTRQVAVRDRGDGFSRESVREGVKQLGGRTSGAEVGASVRGNRGRGLRDLVTFGPVCVRSIRSGLYSEVPLTAKGLDPVHRRATKDDHEEIGVHERGSGTEVRVSVGKHVTLPRFSTLARKLTHHCELRDLCSRDNYEVALTDEATSERQALRYESPATTEVLFDGEIEIEGYAGPAHLHLERLVERCDRGRTDYERACGVIIKGAVASYENTLSKFEGNAWAGYICGELRFPLIDVLIDEYDQRIERGETPETSNPTQILTRNRDGLHTSHPATRAIHAALDVQLEKAIAHIEKESRESSRSETDPATRRTLSQLARVLAEERRLIEEEEELESDEEVVGPVSGLSIIPPRIRRAIDAGPFTVSVRAPRRPDLEGAELRLQLVPEGVVELGRETSAKLLPSLRRSDLLTATVRLSPRREDECRLLAAAGSELAAAAIEISAPQPAYMPATLEFENRTYTARLGRRKTVRLLIPTELLDGAANTTVSVASSDPDSVAVLGGGRATFVANGERGVAAAELKVQGRVVGKSATLRATVGSLTATARVACTEGEELGVPNVHLSRDDPSLYPAFMGDSDGKRVIKVFVRHPILAPYFATDGVLELKDVSAAVVADVLADFFARDLTSRKLDPTRASPEVDDVYTEHYRVKQRMVKVAQACLISAPASTADQAGHA